MKLSANLIRNFNTLNSFSYGDWAIRANEAQVLYFQITDLDQQPWSIPNETAWPGIVQQQSVIPNSLRYLTGQNGNTPVVVTVQFPTLDCKNSPLIITATAVSASDASLFSISLTNLQVPGSGNIIFKVQEGSNIHSFFIQDGITVENPFNLGQC